MRQYCSLSITTECYIKKKYKYFMVTGQLIFDKKNDKRKWKKKSLRSGKIRMPSKIKRSVEFGKVTFISWDIPWTYDI